jgi:UDP-N-acetylmuramoyl-tripeptide--D-alanyl-D-alanine ligase
MDDSSADYVGRMLDEQTLDVQGVTYRLPLPGEHILRNAIRAIVLGLEFGIAPEKIAEGLLHFQLPPMRWECSTIKEINFINDAYNANPISMRAALRTFAQQSAEGKKWVVLGGMRELGKNSSQAHADLGAFVENLGFDGVVSVGALAQGFDPEKSRNIHFYPTSEQAVTFLKTQLLPGDVVLLKASRGEALEQIINHFKEN